jgi:hypothetical protein
MLDFDNNIQKGEGDVSYCIIWDGQPRDLRLPLDRTVHQCDSALAENSEYHSHKVFYLRESHCRCLETTRGHYIYILEPFRSLEAR